MFVGVADDLLVRRDRTEHQLDAEPLLVLEGDAARQPFPRFVLDRLVHLGQPLGADFGRPPCRQRILERVDHVQAGAERLRQLTREHDGPVERLVHSAVQQDFPHRCAGHGTSMETF